MDALSTFLVSLCSVAILLVTPKILEKRVKKAQETKNQSDIQYEYKTKD
jgi:hypothetical protein